MRKEYFLTLLLCGGLLLSLLTGCKSSQKTVETVATSEVKTHEVFFDSMEEQSFKFHTMTARLSVELEKPRHVSSRVDLKIVKDSTLLLSVQPFLGIEVFRVELSVDTIKVLDRLNKRYLSENYSELKGKTPVEFNFYNLQALFTNHLFIPGERTISKELYHRFKLNQEGTSAEIKLKDAMDFLYTFMADGEEKLLSTYVNDAKDQYALNWVYSDFRLVGEQPFPMLMNVQIIKDKNTVGELNISYSKIQLDTPIKSGFSIPTKYKRVTFDELLKSTKNLNKQE